METRAKLVKDIFRDYEAKSNVIEAKIDNINLYKKLNKIGIQMFSKEYMQLKNLLDFEKYLINRFSIENVEIEVKYDENVNTPSIQNEWHNIVAYMSYKYPLAKILLQNSTLQIEDNKLTVVLSIKGAEFLTARGFGKV